ncbi:MAG TPA: hypothetical protein VGL38_12665 [bacterium]|jgi:hypothetical protein
MRNFWILVLGLFILPALAFAQYDTLKCNTDGAPESFFGGWGANAEGYVKLVPTSAQFRLDSIKVFGYRASTAYAAQLNIRIEIFSATGTPPNGACGCTTGPGTVLRQYPSATGTFAMNWGTAVGTKWFAFAVPHDTLAGAFIVGIKYVSITGTGAYPSILWDNESTLITCCDQYWNYQAAAGIRDNEAMFTTTPGPQYIQAKGWRIGAAAPGHLTLGTLEGMGGAALDSTVTDTLVLGNSGGTSLTVQSIASDLASFTTDPVGAGIVIAPGATRKLGVHFTPTVAGEDTATLTFTDNVPNSQVSTKMLWGRGISHTNLLIYENWWNANGNGWPIYRFGNDTSAAQWGLYYNGGHSDNFCNIALGHPYTAASVPPVDDVVLTPFLQAPASHNIRVNWREQTLFPSFVFLHGLVVADSDTNVYVLDTLGLANTTQEWADYPTTWYINGIDSAFRRFEVGFEYAGTDADLWYLDDINVSDVPQLPPSFTMADPRGDAFASDQQITASAFDANSDPFTITAHITPLNGVVANYPMTETPAGSGNFCLNFSAFLSGAGSYSYYLTAQDAHGSTRWPVAGTYTFEVQTAMGATELTHHNGTWTNAHYYFNLASLDAERFTPASYPFVLTGAKVGILNGWPNAAHEQIEVKVFAGDGAGGLPGTELYSQVTGSIGNVCGGYPDTTFANHFANVVFFPSGLTINSGTFYIAIGNPATAVAPAVEGWTFDSLGHGTTYAFDATAGTWALQPDSNGTLMVSAIGFSTPVAPHLAVYPNNSNTAAMIYVQEAGTGGALPYPMNLYVSNPWTGAQTLVAGSPFTVSPITYVYPGTSPNYFFGKFLANLVSLSVQVPETMPVLPTSSLITAADNSIPVRAASGVQSCDVNTRPSPAPHVPSLVLRNDATGESTLIPFSKRLGKPTSVSTLRPVSSPVGPVRESVTKTGFTEARAF